MSSPRILLPQEFRDRPFALADALHAGVTRGRLAGTDLEIPFRGVRTPSGWRRDGIRNAALAYAPRLRARQAFGGVSAAALWGLPLPFSIERSGRVELAVPRGRNRPRVSGVNVRTIRTELWHIEGINGFPVTSPSLTVQMLARVLPPRDLAVVVDALRSVSSNYLGIAQGVRRPLASSDELDLAVASSKWMHGAANLRDAISFGRDGVESPRETHLRWAIVRIGRLPEPEINAAVWSGGRRLGRPDMSYPLARLGLEYEGDEHRVDRERWQRDIARVENFTDAGWRIMRVTNRDLSPDPWPLLRRIAARLRTFDVPLGGYVDR